MPLIPTYAPPPAILPTGLTASLIQQRITQAEVTAAPIREKAVERAVEKTAAQIVLKTYREDIAPVKFFMPTPSIIPWLPWGSYGVTVTPSPVPGGIPSTDVETTLTGAPTPEEDEITQPIIPFLGATDTYYGEKITERQKEYYKETYHKELIKEVGEFKLPEIKLPEFPDIIGGIKNTLIIAAVALGGLFLLGKVISRKK